MLETNNDALYVFSHFLDHFYKGGVGIRQICDWCRLLWTHRTLLDYGLLESQIKRMGLISEWKAFGAFAVEYLGMPADAMPLYDNNKKWNRKAFLIKKFILMSGNFGHNRDMDYYGKYPYIIRKAISLRRRICDLFQHARIFPIDSLRFLPNLFFYGLKSAIRGE